MTLAEQAYGDIRQDIIAGLLPPDLPLRMEELKSRYNAGFSPLREALNRLQSERLVISQSLRGFKVAPMSVEELNDSMNMRILIETDALKKSIERGDDDWAANIVSSQYALNVQAQRQDICGEIFELEARHHVFHRALLSSCGSPWALEMFERLYAATERYRASSLSNKTARYGRDIQDEHSNLAEAVLDRDPDTATKLLSEHYRRTADMISQQMVS